jgi:hypothetical protein
MYRCGFGDAFLLTFREAAEERHVLVDFGVHLTGKIGTMDAIMDDIERATGKRLLLVVASHPHLDHISGFDQFHDRFRRFQIERVWLPWTDNIHDPAVAALERRQLALLRRLRVHLAQARPARKRTPLYAAALEALHNLDGDQTERAKEALRGGLGDASRVRYLHAGSTPLTVGGFGDLTMEVLSPPDDRKFFGRQDPPAGQRFLTEPGDDSTTLRPFERLEIAPDDPELSEIAGQPLLDATDLERLHAAVETPAERLALMLDNARNNTSLVILFRFHGRSLLFPGDAQWGNWQSWIGTDRGRQILAQLDFLKVGHHGSENATPVSVVEGLRSAGVGVMVSTQIRPFKTIPRLPLLTELEKHAAANVVVRSDWVKVPEAVEGPLPVPPLPPGVTIGEHWIDYEL